MRNHPPWPFWSLKGWKALNHCFQGASSCCSIHDKKQLSNKQKMFTYNSWYLTGKNRKFTAWTTGHRPPSKIRAGRKSLFRSSFIWGTLFPVEKPMYVKNISKSSGPNRSPSIATLVVTNRKVFGRSRSRDLINWSKPSYLRMMNKKQTSDIYFITHLQQSSTLHSLVCGSIN